MVKKPESAASLRGVMSQVKKHINEANKMGQANVVMPIKLAKRVHKALSEFERNERILTYSGIVKGI